MKKIVTLFGAVISFLVLWALFFDRNLLFGFQNASPYKLLIIGLTFAFVLLVAVLVALRGRKSENNPGTRKTNPKLFIVMGLLIVISNGFLIFENGPDKYRYLQVFVGFVFLATGVHQKIRRGQKGEE